LDASAHSGRSSIVVSTGAQPSTTSSTSTTGGVDPATLARLVAIIQQQDHSATAGSADPGYGGAAPGAAGGGSQIDPNNTAAKRAFQDQGSDQDGYQLPHPELTVIAGDGIAAARLQTGINTSVPGPLVARVEEPVCDTLSGRNLLIPPGTWIYGEYDAAISYGQGIVQGVITRLTLPNGFVKPLRRAVATEPDGSIGMTGQVDNHNGKLFQAGILSTILALPAALAGGTINPTTGQPLYGNVLASGIASGATRVGQTKINQQLSEAPTITKQPGDLIGIVFSSDVAMPSAYPMVGFKGCGSAAGQ
jgi:type IV secretion system protein VirB10